MKCHILDLNFGNIQSISSALKHVGSEINLLQSSQDFKNVQRLVIPGVGSFNSFMKKIKEKNLDYEIKNIVAKGVPVLGICLGMQVLLSKGFEFGEIKGLNLLKGYVKKIDNEVKNKKTKLPLVGWHTMTLSKYSNELIRDCNPFQFYHMHSYYCEMSESNNVNGYINYNNKLIPCLISNENVFGVQFHPEKSGKAGLSLLSNFFKIK